MKDVKYVVPNNVTTIGAYAFGSDTVIQEIILPATVYSLQYDAFTGCTSLKTIKYLGSKAPTSCSSPWGTVKATIIVPDNYASTTMCSRTVTKESDVITG